MRLKQSQCGVKQAVIAGCVTQSTPRNNRCCPFYDCTRVYMHTEVVAAVAIVADCLDCWTTEKCCLAIRSRATSEPLLKDNLFNRYHSYMHYYINTNTYQ